MAEAKKGGSSSGKGAKGKTAKDKNNAKSSAKPEVKENAPEVTEKSNSAEPTETAAVDAHISQETPTVPSANDSKENQKDGYAPLANKGEKIQQQRVSHYLDAVLDDPPAEPSSHHGFKHPLFLDVILAIGLLVAMAGFSIGMFKIYITHSAKQSINQQNYHAAIALLKGTPLPGFFNIAGSEDTQELLNRALYLDAISKLEINRDDASAIKELEQITSGSGYFELAQDLLRDNTPPSKLHLEGGASHEAAPTDPEIKENKPIIPDDDLKDGSP